MSNYYNTFRARMTADGFSYKEQIENLARKNFEMYLNETPTSEEVLIGGQKFKVAIVENKQDESRLSKQMFSAIYDYFPVGSLVIWKRFDPYDCPENHWIIWKQQQNSIQDHYVNYISRCNHKLKWIDGAGVRHEQYIYEFSSKENMIRATFKSRVQEIIASEPNKFMEIIMPYTDDIKREQRFIVDGEAWYVIEFDSSSVDGITYITLGEDKKDLQNDLLLAQGDSEDLADYKKENKNFISVLEEEPIIEKNTPYIIKPYYYEDGNLVNTTYNFYINGYKVETGSFYEQIYSKDTEVIITLASNENIQKSIYIQVSEEPQDTVTYEIIGDSKIRWGKTAEYTVEAQTLGYIGIVQNPQFSIDNNSLATLEIEGNVCYITANNKRKVGKIILTASGDDFTLEKIIDITSLW